MIFVSHFQAIEAPVTAECTLAFEDRLNLGLMFEEFPRAVTYLARQVINWPQSFARRGLNRSEWSEPQMLGHEGSVLQFRQKRDEGICVDFQPEHLVFSMQKEPVLRVRKMGLTRIPAASEYFRSLGGRCALRSSVWVEKLERDPAISAECRAFCVTALARWDPMFSFLLVEHRPEFLPE